MTQPQNNNDTIPCSICGDQHPTLESVTVDPPGLSAGLGCLTAGVRRLLGLPDPGDSGIGAAQTPPSLRGWNAKPSKLFLVDLAQTPNESNNESNTESNTESGINAEHFRRALNHMGLAPILRAQYAASNCRTTLEINGNDVIFTFSAYTAASEAVHIWSEALTDEEDDPKILGMARLNWMPSPRQTGHNDAQRRAYEFVSRTRHAGPDPNPGEDADSD